MFEPCLLCAGSPQNVRRPDLPGVTSDCRSWPRLAPLWACPSCGLVQKAADSAWHADAEAIYGGYGMYELSGGREQLVFGGKLPAARSRVLLTAAHEAGIVPRTGTMLDFGCGNGALFGQFRELFPGWRVAGLERDAARLVGAPRENTPDELYEGSLEAVPGTFHLVTMLHVLEHLDDPVSVLRNVRSLLAPGGALVILCPDYTRNPFDLSIVDHRFHLTKEIACAMLLKAGYPPPTELDGPPKELALAVRLEPSDAKVGVSAPEAGRTDAADLLDEGLWWLEAVVEHAKSLTREGTLGIFGTAIAGAWLASALGSRASFFVDEDPDRQGKTHMGLPVLDPSRLPGGSRAYLALPPSQAAGVAARLGARFIEPPSGRTP